MSAYRLRVFLVQRRTLPAQGVAYLASDLKLNCIIQCCGFVKTGTGRLTLLAAGPACPLSSGTKTIK